MRNKAIARELKDDEIKSLCDIKLPASIKGENFSDYLSRIDSSGVSKGWKIKMIITFRSSVVYKELFNKKAKDVEIFIKGGRFYHGGDWNLWDIIDLMRGLQVAEISIDGVTAEGEKILAISSTE